MQTVQLIPLDCPACGGHLTVNPEHDAALCHYCGAKISLARSVMTQTLYFTNVRCGRCCREQPRS